MHIYACETFARRTCVPFAHTQSRARTHIHAYTHAYTLMSCTCIAYQTRTHAHSLVAGRSAALPHMMRGVFMLIICFQTAHTFTPALLLTTPHTHTSTALPTYHLRAPLPHHRRASPPRHTPLNALLPAAATTAIAGGICYRCMWNYNDVGGNVIM
jgi:hypothetical protein